MRAHANCTAQGADQQDDSHGGDEPQRGVSDLLDVFHLTPADYRPRIMRKPGSPTLDFRVMIASQKS